MWFGHLGTWLDLNPVGETLPRATDVFFADHSRQWRFELTLGRGIVEGKNRAVFLISTEIRALVDGAL